MYIFKHFHGILQISKDCLLQNQINISNLKNCHTYMYYVQFPECCTCTKDLLPSGPQLHDGQHPCPSPVCPCQETGSCGI